MKWFIMFITVASLILGSMTFADEQKQSKKSTIVGPVMQNRYIHVTPKDDQTQEGLSETSKKLMDQGVIPAAEAARQNQTQQVVQPVRNN